MFEAVRLLVDAIFPSMEHRDTRERQRMEAFLSQAKDRNHLEVLERQWFNRRSRG
jgi:hypothetical protein